MAEPTSISDAEWQVMEAVWAITPPDAPASDVIDTLKASTRWSAATIKTMLNRLVKKGVLATRAEGRRFLYSAVVSREQCVRSESRSFLQRLFRGQAGPMLVHLVRETKLSPDEVAELKKILDQQANRSEKRR